MLIYLLAGSVIVGGPLLLWYVRRRPNTGGQFAAAPTRAKRQTPLRQAQPPPSQATQAPPPAPPASELGADPDLEDRLERMRWRAAQQLIALTGAERVPDMVRTYVKTAKDPIVGATLFASRLECDLGKLSQRNPGGPDPAERERFAGRTKMICTLEAEIQPFPAKEQYRETAVSILDDGRFIALGDLARTLELLRETRTTLKRALNLSTGHDEIPILTSLAREFEATEGVLHHAPPKDISQTLRAAEERADAARRYLALATTVSEASRQWAYVSSLLVSRGLTYSDAYQSAATRKDSALAIICGEGALGYQIREATTSLDAALNDIKAIAKDGNIAL